MTTTKTKAWPGSSDGRCPDCGELRDDWDLEYRVAKISPLFGVIGMMDKLVALTCRGCNTKFTIPEST